MHADEDTSPGARSTPRSTAKGPAKGGEEPDRAVVPPPVPKKKRKSKAGKPRGETELDPELARLVRVIGRNKVVPDTTAIERHYSRSLRIRQRIMEFLLMNRDTTWIDLAELYAQAANYAGCASQTSAKWVYQLTRQDAPFRLVEGVDRWILERRE